MVRGEAAISGEGAKRGPLAEFNDPVFRGRNTATLDPWSEGGERRGLKERGRGSKEREGERDTKRRGGTEGERRKEEGDRRREKERGRGSKDKEGEGGIEREQRREGGD